MLVEAGRGVLDAVGAGWRGRGMQGVTLGEAGNVNNVNITRMDAGGAYLLLGAIGGGFGRGKNICRV
jgi:hypothetical protein